MGVFLPEHFPVPEALAENVAKAYRDGNTNYPPSSGVPELCEAVASIYRDFFGLDYGADGVVIGSGARPPLYATWALFAQPGDHTVSFLPSWNSRYYKHLMQTNHQFIATTQANNFHPTLEQIQQILPTVQLISMNSPLNPTGTVIDPAVLKQIAESIVDENTRRKSQRRRPVMWLYDQVYWMLLEEGYQHVSPVQLCPEVAPPMWCTLMPRASALLQRVCVWAGVCCRPICSPRCEASSVTWVLGPPNLSKWQLLNFLAIARHSLLT